MWAGAYQLHICPDSAPNASSPARSPPAHRESRKWQAVNRQRHERARLSNDRAYRDWDWAQRLSAGIALAVRQRMPCKLSVTCAKEGLGDARFEHTADGASSTCQTILGLGIDFVPDPTISTNAHSADAAPRSAQLAPIFLWFLCCAVVCCC
jgi:hypothetical protein